MADPLPISKEEILRFIQTGSIATPSATPSIPDAPIIDAKEQERLRAAAEAARRRQEEEARRLQDARQAAFAPTPSPFPQGPLSTPAMLPQPEGLPPLAALLPEPPFGQQPFNRQAARALSEIYQASGPPEPSTISRMIDIVTSPFGINVPWGDIGTGYAAGAVPAFERVTGLEIPYGRQDADQILRLQGIDPVTARERVSVLPQLKRQLNKNLQDKFKGDQSITIGGQSLAQASADIDNMLQPLVLLQRAIEEADRQALLPAPGTIQGLTAALADPLRLGKPPRTPEEMRGWLDTLTLSLPPAGAVLQGTGAQIRALGPLIRASGTAQRASGAAQRFGGVLPRLRPPLGPIVGRVPEGGQGVIRGIEEYFPGGMPSQATAQTTRYAPPVSGGRELQLQIRPPSPIRLPYGLAKPFTMPRIVRRLQDLMLTDDAMALNAADRQSLKGFLQRNGISPQEAPEVLGSVERSPVTGDIQFVVGAYRNPIWQQRVYIVWNPKANKFTTQLNLGDTASARDLGTGELEKFETLWERLYGTRLRKLAARPAPEEAPPFVAAQTGRVTDPAVDMGRDLFGRHSNRASLAPDGPRVTDPSGRAGRVAGLTEQPEDILASVQESAFRGETPGQSRLILHEGALVAAEAEIRIISDAGSQRLKDLGIGVMRGGRLVIRERDIKIVDDLYNALHNPSKVASGEVRVPRRLQAEYNALRQETNWEEAMRLDFDPSQAKADDYFYRGWKARDEDIIRGTGPDRGRLGARPGFRHPRQDATYLEMRDRGFEPLFWNPWDQLRYSEMLGVRHRQQAQLLQDLKRIGAAVPVTGKELPDGWRVPKVGPAFEGKPYARDIPGGGHEVGYAHRYIVANKMANRLESVYGRRSDFLTVSPFGREIDLMKAIDAAVFIPKRAKLFASIFQQRDFLQRTLHGTWSEVVDAIRARMPVDAVKALAIWPKAAYQVLEANLGPGARIRLRKIFNSTDPILPKSFNRPNVHMRGLVERGLSRADVTILLEEEVGTAARLAAEDEGLLGVKKIARLVADLEGAMKRGLFEGVYPAAILHDVRNNIAPMLARKWPNVSDDVLMGMIARETNIMYSTIPASQSIFVNRVVRETLRRIFFSIGENEGLLRQATRAIRGQNASFWRKRWLGTYLSLLATANAIHFASTGEPLPFDRYAPISKDKWGPFPFSYNPDFASPNVPFTDKTGRQLLLDVVSQYDTVFRILDPINWLTSRESVPIRAIETQVEAENFSGTHIDTVGPWGILSRIAQLANDLFIPIGSGQAALQGLREVIPGMGSVVPEVEGRIGISGHAMQSGGLNVKTETMEAFKNSIAQQDYGKNFDDLTIQQQNEINMRPEVQARQELFEKTRPPKLRPKEALEAGRTRYFKRQDELVIDLRKAIEGGRKAVELRKAVQDFLRNRGQAWQASISPELDELLRSNITDALDLWRDRYWSVDIPEDPATGIKDYDKWQRDREDILLEADRVGVPRADITFRRGTGDPIVDNVLNQYWTDHEILRDQYFNLTKITANHLDIGDEYIAYLKKPSNERDIFLLGHPKLKNLFKSNSILNRPIDHKLGPGAKASRRLLSEIVDRNLMKWGYVENPIHPTIVIEEENRIVPLIKEMLQELQPVGAP